jgi:hypothetical protein
MVCHKQDEFTLGVEDWFNTRNLTYSFIYWWNLLHYTLKIKKQKIYVKNNFDKFYIVYDEKNS